MTCVGIFLVLLSSVSQSEGLKVLTTNPSLMLPDRFGQVELVNSSLQGRPEVTICVRFRTFQFSTYGKPWYAQSVITYADSTTLYAYVATDCEDKFPGCNLRYKKLVAHWAHGRVFGYFYENTQSSGYYPAWRPGVWNQACITASDSQGFFDININGETQFRTENYRKTLSRRNHNIVLMNDGGYWEGLPMHGSVTDVQVWGRLLSREEMVAWYHCNTTIAGDIIDWQTVSLKINQINITHLDKSTICMKPKGPVFRAFRTKRNFDETLYTCQSINGQIAVAEDRQKYEEMNETFVQSCPSSAQFYTGYFKQEDAWLDANTRTPTTLTNWAETFPTNYFGYNCTYSAAGYELQDYVCSDRTCPICQVQPTEFTLRGVCLDSAVDKFYFTEQFDDFLGYATSRLVFAESRDQWEIVNNTNTAQVLAVMEGSGGCPVGLNRWTFLQTNCTGKVTQFNIYLGFKI